MFNGNGYMVGMHGGWGLFLMLGIGVALFYAWQRQEPSGKGPDDKPQETVHEVLRRRLAGGDITPQQYVEHKALLDRDD